MESRERVSVMRKKSAIILVIRKLQQGLILLIQEISVRILLWFHESIGNLLLFISQFIIRHREEFLKVCFF